MTTLLTIPEAAKELRVGKSTVYDWISDGRIKTVNLAEKGKASKTRIERKALDAFIASCADKARGTAA